MTRLLISAVILGLAAPAAIASIQATTQDGPTVHAASPAIPLIQEARRGRGADDPAGHERRGRGRGTDDGPNHG